MTNQQILEKAIQKATNGGWDPKKGLKLAAESSLVSGLTVIEASPLYIFSHDFAKALWGQEIGQDMKSITDHTSREQYIRSLVPAWQFHLQMMVIADDPIKYLGENL